MQLLRVACLHPGATDDESEIAPETVGTYDRYLAPRSSEVAATMTSVSSAYGYIWVLRWRGTI